MAAAPGSLRPARLAVAGLVVLTAATILAMVLPGGALAAPAWLAPSDLSATGQMVERPQVAVDPQGDAVAVWARSNGSDLIIGSAERPAGGTWSAPVELSAPGEEAHGAQVALDAGGDAVAVWERSNGSNVVVESAERPAGGTWSAPVELSAPGEEATNPELAVDPRGDAVAVWQRTEGAHNVIVRGAERPAGGSWSAPTNITAPGEEAFHPQVAIDSQGDAVAVWVRADEAIESAVRPAGGSWSAPSELTAAGGSENNPQVGIDSTGDAVAVWEGFDGTNFFVEGAERPAGGAWSAAGPLSAPGESAFAPQLAVDPKGDAVAAWSHSNEVIRTAERPAGGTWSAPVDLSPTGGEVFTPQVAVDPQGDAVAAWEGVEGPDVIIQGATRPAGGAWSTPSGLSATGDNASSPRIAVDPFGDAVTVWVRSETVQAAAYDAAGPQLRGLSIPTTGQAVAAPVDFSVSPFDVWSPLGTTSWTFGDGTGATGDAVGHTYESKGTFTVTVTATDALGNTSTATGTVDIAPASVGRTGSDGRARAKRLVQVKGRLARLALSCPEGTSCTGVVLLFARVRTGGAKKAAGASARKKPKRIKLGANSDIYLPAGTHRTVKIRISREARALVAAARGRGLKANLTGSGVVGRSVMLKAIGRRRHRPGGRRHPS
jgi:hypothetical protein